MSKTEKNVAVTTEAGAGRLDALYDEIAQQRSMNKRASLVGILCVIIILLIFCLKLYGIFNEYQKFAKGVDSGALMTALQDPSYDGAVSKHDNPQIEEAVRDVIKEGHARMVPALKASQEMLIKKILPDFSKRVTDKMAENHDNFQKAGVQLQENLSKHVEKLVKEDLMGIMGVEMMKMSDELRAEFPELSDHNLEKELRASEAYFYDELHDLGMRKIAKFDPVLRSLSMRIDSLVKDKKVTPEMREQIANDFFEALFDRMKYEFVPTLGEQIIKPTEDAKEKAPKKKAPKEATATKKGGVR